MFFNLLQENLYLVLPFSQVGSIIEE
jgi:hypothetical protein